MQNIDEMQTHKPLINNISFSAEKLEKQKFIRAIIHSLNDIKAG